MGEKNRMVRRGSLVPSKVAPSLTKLRYKSKSCHGNLKDDGKSEGQNFFSACHQLLCPNMVY